MRQAFSGLRFDIEDVSSDGEKVVVRVTASGRHTGAGGPLRHLSVTGREFRVQHIHTFRVADGKVAEPWACRDDLGQLVQLGAAACMSPIKRSSTRSVSMPSVF